MISMDRPIFFTEDRKAKPRIQNSLRPSRASVRKK